MGSDPNQLFEQFFRAKLNMKNNDINLETNRSILENQEYLEYSPSSFCEKEMNHGTKSIPKQLDMTSTESKQGQKMRKAQILLHVDKLKPDLSRKQKHTVLLLGHVFAQHFFDFDQVSYSSAKKWALRSTRSKDFY